MPIDHVLPRNLDELYGPGAEQADIVPDVDTYVRRDVTLEFYRSSIPHSECTIERNGVRRTYKIREPRITQIQRIIRKNKIPVEVDFMYFTVIEFQADKE